jgi:hypothetical protein
MGRGRHSGACASCFWRIPSPTNWDVVVQGAEDVVVMGAGEVGQVSGQGVGGPYRQAVRRVSRRDTGQPLKARDLHSDRPSILDVFKGLRSKLVHVLSWPSLVFLI